MTENSRKRETAKKVRINDMIKGQYFKEEGEWEPNYIITPSKKKLSRANVIGVVVSRQDDESFSSIIIDDSTGKITGRVFRDDLKILKDIEIGDIILAIGRPKEYGNEKYLLIEIAKRLEDKRWIEVRKKEIEMKGLEENLDETAVNIVSEESATEGKNIADADEGSVEEDAVSGEQKQKNTADLIIEFVREHDNGEGVDFEDIMKKFDDEDMIKNLLGEGELFEIRPGRLKVLE